MIEYDTTIDVEIVITYILTLFVCCVSYHYAQFQLQIQLVPRHKKSHDKQVNCIIIDYLGE